MILSKFELKYKPYGERSILIEWPQEINKNILFDILKFKKILQKEYDKQKVEVNSAYNSILITYTSTINNIYDKILVLKDLYSSKFDEANTTFKLWRVPVCYDDGFALDLDQFSTEKRLSKNEIINRHCQSAYTVFFIGFLPGFLYLGGLDKILYMPRLSKPRLDLIKGAVGIGGHQTGIYPNDGPGGWNIIGNSPINLFNVNSEKPCFAQAGDSIQFYKVSLDEHRKIQELEATGYYQIESEVVND